MEISSPRMEPQSEEFDEVHAMLSSLFGEEEDDDDDGDDKSSLSLSPPFSFVSSHTLSGPPLPEEDTEDAWSSSVAVRNEKEGNADVGSSSSSLLGKRKDVRDMETMWDSCKKVKGNNGVFENFVGFLDRPEIDEKCSELGENEGENRGFGNCLGEGFDDHDLESADLLELLAYLEEQPLDPVVDGKDDCGQFGMASLPQLDDEFVRDELLQMLNNNNGEMDPAIDDEHAQFLMEDQTSVADGEGDEIDALANPEQDYSQRLVVEIVIHLIL